MTKSRIFLILSLSFIIGIFWTSFAEINYLVIYVFSIISIITITIGYKNKLALVTGLAFLFLTVGIWRTQVDLKKVAENNLDEKNISGNVIVIKEPEQKDAYQNVVVRTSDNIRVLLRANINSAINYGDELKTDCTLKIPEDISGTTQNNTQKNAEFDYRMYLAKDKIFYLCQNAKFEKTGRNFGNKIYAGILNLKNMMSENVSRIIPYPESALANGLIFGGSSDLPKTLKNNFSRTGLTHIVAVSGYNVTIIAEYLIIFGIFVGLWRKQAFWFAIFGIIIFITMCGFPSSAVRAGVMGSLLLWAMKNGRLANSWNAIIFAAGIMLLINPLLLRWDIGFQLSFLATLGIIALAPFWEKNLVKKHKAFGFTEVILLSLSAQIFVLPIILYNFHTFSAISLLANALILPIIPISMLLVFLSSLAGFLGGIFSLPFAWLAFLLLKYETLIINLLAGLSWSSLEVKNFSAWMAAAWYFFFLAGVIFFKHDRVNVLKKEEEK